MSDFLTWAQGLERDPSPPPQPKARPARPESGNRGAVSVPTDEEESEKECRPRPAGADLEIEAGGLRPSPQRASKESESGSSILSCVANLANTNMGVGMLALPSAMADAGMAGGVALILLSAAIATFGSALIADCVDAVGRPATMSKVTCNAMALLPRPLGVAGIVLVDVAVVVIATSCAIGYLIVVGDTMPEIKDWFGGVYDSVDSDAEAAAIGVGATPPQQHSAFDSREFWILAVLPVIVPLAYLRRIDSLRFASYLVVGCVGLILLTVALFATQPTPLFDPCAGSGELGGQRRRLSGCHGPVVPLRDPQHLLTALPTFLFAYAAQINVPAIMSELRQPTPARVRAVLLGGVGLTTTCYLVVAGGGYYTYGAYVTGDLLLAYPSAAIVARLALIFVVVFSHPVVSFPVAACISNSCSLIAGCCHGKGPQEVSATLSSPPPTDDGAASSRFVNEPMHATVIALYLLGTTIVALSVSDLGLVIALAGAVSATIAVFIAPGACFVALHRAQGCGLKRVLAATLGVTGVVLMPLLAFLVLATDGFLGPEWT